jgi:SpoVK/Ycf46/Vps4 family AAA+-type ATPase
MSVFYAPWQSNVTFDNRFFTGKKEILDKIQFFLNNEDWYKDRGIPYTLGILLWGEPGCGKTGFIKALMNLTKRHGIDIKLSKKFDMNSLREVICDDEINSDIIIPQNNRILLFEDIDAMGDVVKDRDLPKEQSEIDINAKIKEALFNNTKKNSRRGSLEDESICPEPSNDNNNLSYFLNILDGLHECPGRIIIMTTNKPEYLDKALVRPGRIDFKINMTKATLEDIKDILEFYWKEDINTIIPENWEQKLSHAQIVSYCRMSDNLANTISKINKFFEIEFYNLNLSPSQSPVLMGEIHHE